MTQWLQVFGRFHVLVLHLPIGLLAGLALVEFVALVRRRPPARDVTGPLAWLAAASAVLAASMGYILSFESGYGGDTLTRHLYLGLALASVCVLTAALHSRTGRAAFRAALVLALIFLVPTGHLGGSMTHGEDFLTAPLNPTPSLPLPGEATPTPAAPTFANAIAPIFDSRCIGCHGPNRAKARLALNTPESIAAGGEHGVIILASDPAKSELLRRLHLPLDHKNHMPPASKPQLSPEQIAAIESWITAGAPFEGEFTVTSPSPLSSFGDKGEGRGEGSTPTSSTSLPSAEPSPRGKGAAPPVPPSSPPPESALSALRTRLAHVEPVERNSTLLWIDFAAAAPTITDADVESLLTPLKDHVAELSLSRTAITDHALAVIAKMPNLRRLELRDTAITDAGIAALAKHPSLEELNLGQTHLTDAVADHLGAIPSLKRVNLWRAGVTHEAAIKLSAAHDSLVIETGDRPVGTPLQSEDAIKLTGDAPPTAAAAPGAAASLKAPNTVCPVSGKPVDPDYVIIYRGRVIGFCCQLCAAQFWADPAKFEKALGN